MASASETHTTDVVVVGAGPIGLELAVALQAAGVDYVHLEAQQVGHTVSWYAPQTTFFSSPERIAIAGVPLVTPDQAKATREQYLAYLRSVVQQFDLRVHTYERVIGIDRLDDGKLDVRTRRGDSTSGTYHASHLVLAVGDMHGPRRLQIPGEDLPHVSHYFQDPHTYFGQRLLIVGGKNSAAEAAIRCHRMGAHVMLSYRREEVDRRAIKYWLLPELESLFRSEEIVFHPRTVPTEIEPGGVTLARVDENERVDEDDTTRLACDFVLLMTGYEQDKSLFEMAGVTLDGENRAPWYDPQTMETDAPGVFVAGTAAAGTQERFRLFIENCHCHVDRIVRAITGSAVPDGVINRAAEAYALPES